MNWMCKHKFIGRHHNIFGISSLSIICTFTHE
uniref:Uncharacterized protein n=1 Tax=Arundo donax TaxID=35708 RepID=A0A0A9ELX8_ARUDO